MTKITRILSITLGSVLAVGAISAAVVVSIVLSNQENRNINNNSPNVQITSTINLKAGVFDNQANPLFWNTIKGVNISISFSSATLNVRTNSFLFF